MLGLPDGTAQRQRLHVPGCEVRRQHVNENDDGEQAVLHSRTDLDRISHYLEKWNPAWLNLKFVEKQGEVDGSGG